MSNKVHHLTFRKYHKLNPAPTLLFQLTNKSKLSVSSLSYSNSTQLHRFINLSNLPSKEEMFPQIPEFQQNLQSQHKNPCKRRDCFDRKFQAIKKLNKSAPNVKIVSPRKIDIVLQDQKQLYQTKKQPSIHSLKRFSPSSRINSQRDLLKEFKEMQCLRKQLKSRKNQKTKTINLGVNNTKNSNFIFEEKAETENPEKGNLYLQVKTRISRRYNSMFRKYAQNIKEQYKQDQQFLKGLFSARGVYRKKQNHAALSETRN